jgi:PIN domain nuclease of toxin-antitoxin system
MTLVLDTQVWLLWLHDPKQLSLDGRRRIARSVERERVFVSAMSIWEIATKARMGRIRLPMELDAWLERARRYRGIRIESVRPDDAIESARLPGATARLDVVDRLVIALARRRAALLLTRDPEILGYAQVNARW